MKMNDRQLRASIYTKKNTKKRGEKTALSIEKITNTQYKENMTKKKRKKKKKKKKKKAMYTRTREKENEKEN